jgi:O-antigen/teichoic acid export membrane protein
MNIVGNPNVQNGPKTGGQSESLKINAVSNWIALFVNVVLGFYITPYIVKDLGKYEYGIWTLTGQLIGYFGLLDFGIGAAVTRFVARYRAQNNSMMMNATVQTAMTIFSGIGLFIFVSSFILSKPIAYFFELEHEKVILFNKIFLMLGAATAISFPANLVEAYIIAHERYLVINVLNIVQGIIRFVFILLLLHYGYGLLGLAFLTMTISIFRLLSNLGISRHILPHIHCMRLCFDRSVFIDIIKFSSITMVIMLAGVLKYYVDGAVIGKSIGIEAVGVYGIASVLIQYYRQFFTRGFGVLQPRFAALDGVQDLCTIRELYLKSIFVSSTMAFGLAVILFIMGKSFILYWVGDGFTEASRVLLILIFAQSFSQSQSPSINLLYAMNKHKYYAYTSIVEGILCLIINIILSLKYGIVGVALGSAITSFIGVIALIVYSVRILQLQIVAYIQAIIIPGLVFLVMIIVSIVIQHDISQPVTLTKLLIQSMIVGCLYGSILAILVRPIRDYVMNKCMILLKRRNGTCPGCR